MSILLGEPPVADIVTTRQLNVLHLGGPELEGFLRDQGIAVAANATLADLQQAVRTELGLDGRAYTIAVARARYGPPETVERGASAARQELRRLLRAARRDLSIWARFRGFVSLRSLRSSGSA